MNDYKTIFYLVKPYFRRVALAGVVGILISALSASLAWLAKPALDDVLIKKNISMLILLPIGVVIVFILKGSLTFLHEYLMKSTAQKMVMDLRNRLYTHVIKLPVEYFSKNSSGSLISKLINDAGMLQSVVSLAIKDLLIESATVIALTGVALYRRWDLTLIALVGLPSAFYVVGRLGQKLKEISKRTQKKISIITEILHESFAGIRIIKIFSMENNGYERLKKNNKDFYRENMRSVRVSECTSLIMESVTGLGIAIVIWYGGKLVVENVITLGDFFSFLTAIFMLYTPAKRLARVNNGIQKARAPLQRVFHLLAEPQEIDGKINIESFKDEIKYDGVFFTYAGAKNKALDNAKFTIKKGMILAIVGKSGSGKTTLINMLTRFYRPDEGKIDIDNRDISTLSLKSLRSLFGVVTQDSILFNDTILCNISFGKPDADIKEVIEASRAAYAHEFIMDFPQGYDTVIGERGVKLSGGQKQRLSIARAIFRNPQILILDEATSSLDTASEMVIQNALENLMKDRTTLVIAHRLSTIRKADRIIVMDKGKIVESGAHEELLKNGGIYQNLYEIQFREQKLPA